FSHRTVAELTEALGGREALTTEEDRRVAPFELISAADRELLPAGVVDAYPLSRVQAGMVVEMLADADLHAYHNVTSFRIRDDLPFAAADLRAAVDLVVARHEVLRTSIHLSGYSQPLQLVHESAVLPVGVRELRDLDETAVEAALREFTARERATLFDLRRPPLLRLHAHVCDDKTWWLSVTECHPIIEGWSHHSLVMEVLEYYRALRRGEKPAPEPLPELRYADFIAAELRALESENDKGYWRDVVTRHAPFELPDGWGVEGTSGPRSAHVTAVTYLDLEDRLRELARAADAPMKSVLLAAHLTVLGQLTAEESFHTGVVLHGRPDVTGAERVYGMYLNTLPIGFRPAAARTWRQAVADVFAAETGMWQHRQYPMPAIAQEFGDGRRLFDTMFIYLDFDQVDRELVDYLSSIDDSPTEFPLSVSVRVGHVGLAVDTRVISPVHAERIAGMYRAVLEAMAASPDGDATGTYLPPGERELLTAGAAAVSVVDRRVHELFGERVAATPD
ncbi:condensation domain-containing protein, partial [Micromonospora sp. DR5-3]|uniref:condensation domain-containing protein n=1 Tax=unclassified Micromonospora TaxID=2617518 RepID=UPI0011DABBB5